MKTMGGVHISTNPNLAMNKDPFDSQMPKNGLNLSVTDEGIRDVALGPSLKFNIFFFRISH